ncbi:MAG: cbb3-type cytochrome c oxidase subunit I, partial [Mycobacteriales bacterium]
MAKGWIQAVLLVSLFGFTVLGFMAAKTYQDEPPIPARVISASGAPLFTGEDVRSGQEVFLRNGLMQYGSIFGHGGYLGPDFTADYLHRSAADVEASYGGADTDARRKTIADFRTNTYDAKTRTLVYSDAQAAAYERLVAHYHGFFSDPAGNTGLRPAAISNPEDTRQLTAYFSWSAWVSAAERPGKTYSYTNNWPGERLVGNEPPANVVVWSVLSLIALLAGIGALLAVFGRWNWLGWHGRDHQELSFRAPDRVKLTPSQKACAGYFLVMAGLFLVQTLVGVASQHYRAEIGGFFGINSDRYLPFNIVRTWHVQLSIFWVVTSFLAAGIFLVPMITARREPKGQSVLTHLLLGALVVVVVGSLLGELAGIHGWFGHLWSWFGMQGF